MKTELTLEQPGTFSYEYDSNGNMTKDSRKALEFSHNVLNLPMTVSSLAGTTVTNTMTYTYLGDGTRVGAKVSMKQLKQVLQIVNAYLR